MGVLSMRTSGAWGVLRKGGGGFDINLQDVGWVERIVRRGV